MHVLFEKKKKQTLSKTNQIYLKLIRIQDSKDYTRIQMRYKRHLEKNKKITTTLRNVMETIYGRELLE